MTVDILSYDEHTTSANRKRKPIWWEAIDGKLVHCDEIKNKNKRKKITNKKNKYCKQNGKLFNKKCVNVTGEPIIFRLFNSCQGLECFVVTKTHSTWMQINIVEMWAKENEKEEKTNDRTHSDIVFEMCHFRKVPNEEKNHGILGFEHFWW